MTARHIFDELAAFLASDTPQVICLSGKWGVGKTHAWNRALQTAKNTKAISLPRYAYVSLFGQNSLEDLRYAIFENTVPGKNAGNEADISTLTTTLKTVGSAWRQAAKAGDFLLQTSGYAAGLSKVGFLTVRDQIVCIDDLERAGDGLRIKDVLGQISYLKEHRRCKVVLLLNEEALSGQNKTDYVAQLEKVVDTILQFQPTPSEASDIGIDASTAFHEQLRSDAIKLGITNIRVLKKIEGYGRKLSCLLEEYDPRVLSQAIHSVTLFAFSKFQPDVAPSIEFIEKSNTFEDFQESQNREEDSHAQWRAMLSEFGFSYLNEMDPALIAGVESGWFDPDRLKAGADILEARIKRRDQDNLFFTAWEAYHGSFDDNAEEVLRLLEEAVASCASAICPMNLSSTVTLFKNLGAEERAAGLIESYVAGRICDLDDWDLDEYPFEGKVSDPDVRAAFNAQKAAVTRRVDPVPILIQIGASRGWSPKDVLAVSKISEDELVAAFKKLRGTELMQAVNGALMFQRIRNGDEAMAVLTANATGALRRIGAESEINRLRVIKLGVSMDAATSNESSQ